MKKLLKFYVSVALTLFLVTGLSIKFSNSAYSATVSVKSMADARNLISSSLNNVSTKISFYAPSTIFNNFTVDTVENIVDTNPLYNSYGGLSYSVDKSSGFSGNLIQVSFEYDLGRNKVLSMKTASEKEATKVINCIIKKGMSIYEKEKAIHDYIGKNVKYVLNSDPAIYTDYGALVNKKAVCQGFALAFYRLCNLAGVPCKFVSGYGADFLSGQVDGHAWNMVKLGSNWYHVDCTWDAGNSYYLYFNISDNDISRDHSWTRSDYPACSITYKNPNITQLPTFSDTSKLEQFLISKAKTNPKSLTFVTINIDASIDSLGSYFDNYNSFNVATSSISVYTIYRITIR